MDSNLPKTATTANLTALLGSRICHDLISPLGAIANGVELLGLSGAHSGPELALIAESVTAANARIRFFRVAFGMAPAEQKIGRAEILSILDDMTRGARTRIDWRGPDEANRKAVKQLFLALLCLETALPWGGQITVNQQEDGWQVSATSDRTKIDPRLWATLTDEEADGNHAPSEVHFALLREEARLLGRPLSCQTAEGRISISL
ncbi:MAG: histidine phosphotransferase family protein [Paracoccaceae bacterium]